MKLPAIVLFLSLTAFVGLFGAAFAWPGILVRCSNEGLQTLADAAMKQLMGRLNEGMQASAVSGSFSPYAGSVDYSLTDIKITNVNVNDLTVRVIPGSGLAVSAGKVEALVQGNFDYTYKLMFIPTSNGGTFALKISDASISVEVTVGMNPDGQPTVDFRDCSASVEDLDLSLEANSANWFLNRFTDTVKEKIRPMLKDAVCDAIQNSRDVIAKEIAKNTKPCLGNACNIRIDLSLVSPPIFGENYTETSHQGEIFWKNDTGLAPYEALPFEALPPSKKMVDVYFNSYVGNTALYALHQNGLLTYKFTTSDQPEACPNVLATSCSENSSLCIGSVFSSVFVKFPNAVVELNNFKTASPPFVSIFNDSLSIAFSVQANVSIRNTNGSLIEERSIFLGGKVDGTPFFNPDALLDFTVANVTLANATISGTEKDRDLFESNDSDAILRLQIIVKECIVPALIASKQSGLSVTNIAGFHTKNRSLMLIPNATAVTFDAFYSNE